MWTWDLPRSLAAASCRTLAPWRCASRRAAIEVAGGVGERGAPDAHLLAGVLNGVHAGSEDVRSGGREHLVDRELVAAVRVGGQRSRWRWAAGVAVGGHGASRGRWWVFAPV